MENVDKRTNRRENIFGKKRKRGKTDAVRSENAGNRKNAIEKKEELTKTDAKT